MLLPGVRYAHGLTAILYAKDIRIFDFPRDTEQLRDAIRMRAQELGSRF